VEEAANVIANAGSNVKNSCPKCVKQSFEIFSGLMAADRGAGVQTLLQMIGTKEMHIWTSKLLKLHHNFGMTLAELGNLIRKLIGFKRSFLSFMHEFDAIICPVCAFPAQPHGTTIAAKNIPAFSYTMTHNLTGWPSVVVRSGTSNEGLPIGVQIVARPWREDIALVLAQCIETFFGGWQRPRL
jgi:amidase